MKLKLKKPLFTILSLFTIGILPLQDLQAQAYALLSRSSDSASIFQCYLLDEMGSPATPQDDRIIDSLLIPASKLNCPFKEIDLVVHHPVLTGNSLSLEISFFKRKQIQNPRDDQWLYSVVWQGDKSQFKQLQRNPPEEILAPGSFKLEMPKALRIDLDSLSKAN